MNTISLLGESQYFDQKNTKTEELRKQLDSKNDKVNLSARYREVHGSCARMVSNKVAFLTSVVVVALPRTGQAGGDEAAGGIVHHGPRCIVFLS